MRRRLRTAAQRAALLALSALMIGGLELLRLPAALLLGSLAAAAALTAFDFEMTIPAPLFAAAQAIIGCLVARVLLPSTLGEMARDWPTFLGGVLSVVGVSVALGWGLTRLRILPGTTAVWGAFPGAATVMTLMSESYGADVRLVALMQYLRVVMVTIVATAVAALWTAATPHAAAAVVWFPPVAWGSLAETVALAAVAAAIGWAFRLPAGPLLVALGAAAVMQNLGIMTDRAAALAPRARLLPRRLEHRSALQPADPRPRRPRPAGGGGVDLVPDRRLWASRRGLGAFRSCRRADRLSRNQPGRRRFGCDHLRVDPGRHALHHGDAGGAISRRPFRRPGDRPLRRRPGGPAN